MAFFDATYDTPGAATWTCPAGVTAIGVICIGGGGAGGKDTSVSAGGGGGGMGRGINYPVTPTVTYDIYVGEGAIANATPAAGSWFNTSGSIFGDLGLNGDEGGNGGSANLGDDTRAGGAGAPAASGNGGGGGGGAGDGATGGAASGFTKGNGGAGTFISGGAGGDGDQYPVYGGFAGSPYGGGGGGCEFDSSPPYDGASGVVYIYYNTVDTINAPSFKSPTGGVAFGGGFTYRQ